jgi:hypothetical protein
MAPLIFSCLESTITAGHDLIQRLHRSSKQRHLDALYVNVFSTYSHGVGEPAGSLLCTVALVKEPATATLLATLLELPLSEVSMLLKSLLDKQLVTTESPLDFVTDEAVFHVCQQALLEVSVDVLNCRLRQGLVDPAKNHEKLLYRCLRLLNRYLCEDICDIRDLRLANADIPDLPARLIRCVPEAVRYACLSWPIHLAASGSVEEGTLSAALHEFCVHHLLHWLELLSLLGEVSSACVRLPQIIAWFEVSSYAGAI